MEIADDWDDEMDFDDEPVPHTEEREDLCEMIDFLELREKKLKAEIERLKAALSLACSEVYRLKECCPLHLHRCARPEDSYDATCDGRAITPGTDGGDIEVVICAIGCWKEHYLSEAEKDQGAAKGGEGE